MSDIPANQPDGEKEQVVDSQRRLFIKNAAAAGVIGAVSAAAIAPAAGAAQQDAEDPKVPPGLKRPAMLSSKYSVCYEKALPAAMNTITSYFAALSRRDLKGISETLNYPHGTYEGADAVVLESAQQLMDTPPQSMNVTGKGNHLIQPGAYDIMDSLEFRIYNPVRVALSMSYSRFRPTGEKILQCDGVYWVTNNDGKWGIEMASTIFNPAEQVGVRYAEAEQAFLKWERDSWLQYVLNDRTAAQNPNGPLRQFGKQVSLPVITGPDIFDAREGNQMERYRIKGIKSRMVVSDVPLTPPPPFNPDPNPVSEAYPYGFLYNGGGEGVGQYKDTMVVPSARVLHSTVNKIHALTGLIRYADDLSKVLKLRYINIYTYKRGRWGMAGGGDPDHYLDYSDSTDNVAS